MSLAAGGVAIAGRSLTSNALIIERVETISLRAPLTRRYAGSAYSMDKRCTIVVRLTTADGVVSETYSGDTDDEQALIVDIIHRELAPAILGRSARDPEGAWSAMEPATYNILRDRGLALQAIAVLDTAIWDVFGRALGQPLYRLWGAVADDLPISVIGGYYHLDLPQTAELIKRYVEMGFAGVKFKVGGRSPAEDAERVRIARIAGGDDIALMVDANQGYTRAEAVDFGRRVADLNIRWFEEPCRWTNDRLWMRDVRYQTGIPVCAGQSELTLRGLRDLVVDGAIDVSNFDASWAGGPTIWRKAAGLCAAFGIEMGHHEEPQVASHLLASIPNHTFVECFDRERDPFFWNLTAMSNRIADGRYRLTEAPGFGIELDWEYVQAHAVDTRVTAR
ncbi:MAG TPA: mandelate racemase/muconate lactonizing enzyme family protein [Candidatus Sulfomarinibacteraceae bacterium]|nr:mandelate racemase/muconate lactonizing enzyme family protein [Candidatus Sulfomarinibacteraceae bacterium]